MGEHTGLLVISFMIVAFGAIIPSYMYFKNYKNIRGRYWGRNKHYLRDHLIGNIVICAFLLIYTFAMYFGDF